MTLQEAIEEWKSRKRHMGCVNATNFLCKRVPGFYPKRLSFEFFHNGETIYTEHVIATDGVIEVDLAPYARGFED